MSGKHSAEEHKHELQELLRVVRGTPDADELAAVIAVLDAMHAEEEASAKGYERPLKSTWARNAAQLRGDVVPGAGQWRASLRRFN